jgi:GNAT superfamily N-acetyltransferase
MPQFDVSVSLADPRLVRIAPLAGLEDPAARLPEIEAIFFESATKKSFVSAEEREAFRQRWLARYLARFPDETFVALAPDGSAAGYLIGCLDSANAGEDFAEAGYGTRLHPAVAEIVARHPAHLHINMRADARGRGVGRRLIEAFMERCRAFGVCGVHVVTGARSRAVDFSRKCGFEPLTAPSWPAPGTLALGARLEEDPETETSAL